MITTLTGSNTFTLKSEMDRLVKVFVDEHTDMGLERIDGEEVEYDRIRESLESLPFLASKKLVVLRAPSANKEFVDHADKLLPEVPESTDVIIVEPKLDKRSAYYKFLKKTTEFKEYNELDEYGIAKWLVEQAKLHGASLQSNDAKYLVERVGANQQMLANEVIKLAAYDDKITRASIDLLTEPNPQSTVFQLLDAAFSGNSKQTMKLYQEQRASKVEPQQIIAMLAWQLHVLSVIKTAGERSDDEIARDARINPFVLRKSRVIASNLQPKKLEKLIADLTDLDLKLKSVSIDADDAVQAYLLSI
jgi:DNA polymerase-3 subunit delta